MMILLSWATILVALANFLPRSDADQAVMKDITLGFGDAFAKCKEESQLTDEIMEEFFHFWRDDFKFEDRELGCALKCMSHHYNLLTDMHKLHHENTMKFFESFPNGAVLSKVLVDIIHTCEKQHDEKEDHCWRILHIAECFKIKCTTSGIAPTIEMIIAELIMEAENA